MSPSADTTQANGPKDLAMAKSDGIEVDIKKTKEGLVNKDIPNIIEHYDATYLAEVSKIDLGNIKSIDPTDHIAMRKWLKDEYMPLQKAPRIKRSRTPVSIDIKNVPITYGEDNHFSIRVYDPVNKEAPSDCLRPALIMLHGGGWVHGYPEVDEDLSQFFASELRAVVIGVDYRLAPEYQFPLPGNDCFEVLNWVSNNARDYSIDTARVGLWGCSAGGNLAASVALRDSAENEISRIRHVSLVVPVTCHPNLHPPVIQSSNASMQLSESDGTVEEARAGLIKLWDMYAGDKFSDPYASVLLAKPRSNHPPAHITVAGCDRLRDEGIAYALLLRNAGIDTQLEIVPGVPHGVTVSPITPVAEQLFRNQIRVLNCALNTDF